MARILVIDDDDDILFVVAATLEELGHHVVTTAESCETAAEVLARERPDLILLDVQMPGTDGPTTLRLLADRDLIRGIPVAFMTANGEPEAQARYLALGAAGVLVKPFEPDGLVRLVASLT